VVWWLVTDVSEDRAASIFSVEVRDKRDTDRVRVKLVKVRAEREYWRNVP
jgi:hypothetical protein